MCSLTKNNTSQHFKPSTIELLMDTPILLYTILFTIEDKPVHKNQYIQMFLIWISCIAKTKSLNENDSFVLIIDKYTLSYLRHETPLNQIFSMMKINCNYIINKQPKTIMEGCMWKYNTFNEERLKIYNKNLIFYSDIDIMFHKSLKLLTNTMIPENIVIHEENAFLQVPDPKYYTEGIPQEEIYKIIKFYVNNRGLSAGKFAIYGTSIALDIFNRIIKYNTEQIKCGYTLEQPLFNRAVYNYFIDNSVKMIYNMNSSICHYDNLNNIYSNNYSIIMIDCCGEPGNSTEHMEKMINTMCILNLL